MEHVHDGAPTRARRREGRRRIATVLALLAAYMVAEAAGGWLSGSLALLADAGHMLSDVAALALALFAIRFAERPPTARRTFGFHRVEILAALFNGALLGAIALLVIVQALVRISEPRPVDGPLMAGVAAGGLAVNLVALFVLHGEHEHSLNARAAWLHVLGDTLGSVGALAAAGLVAWKGWTWADPAASIAIALLIVVASARLVRETVSVLMESAPGHVDVDRLERELRAVGGVRSVRDLHVWTITSGFEALSAHVAIEPGTPPLRVLRELRALVRERFGIEHTTIEVDEEARDAGCRPLT